MKSLLHYKRVNVNQVESNDRTPFYAACLSGSIEAVTLLLNDPRVEVNRGDMNDQTPFYVACSYGHLGVIRLLLDDERVDINLAERNGWTPLFFVCFQTQSEVVEYILACRREVDLSARNIDGKSAIDVVSERQKDEKGFWEKEKDYKAKIKRCGKIVKLLESYERNSCETRTKLRIQLGFAGKINFNLFYFIFYFGLT